MNVATVSHGFDQGGSCSRLLSSLRALYALNISIATSTDRLRVLALVRPVVSDSRVITDGCKATLAALHSAAYDIRSSVDMKHGK